MQQNASGRWPRWFIANGCATRMNADARGLILGRFAAKFVAAGAVLPRRFFICVHPCLSALTGAARSALRR
jgi:hypothetical protein